MADLIDISPLISPRIGVWPGDTPFSQQFLCRSFANLMGNSSYEK